MSTVITGLEQVNAAWLTEVLRRNSALTAGVVVAVNLEQNAAFNSSIARLQAEFSSDAAPALPSRLLVKLNADGGGELEVAFYRLAREQPTPVPGLVRCFAAEYDAHTGHSVLVLEDLSQTHVTPTVRARVLALDGVPAPEHCDGVIDALARFHAYWWQHPIVGQEPLYIVRPWFTDAERHAAHVERRRKEWQAFHVQYGQEIPAEWTALYTHALEQLPGLFQRFLEPRVTTLRALTLSNGDAYFNQFLCPRDAGDDTRIIDFQDVGGNFGAFDLVYLLPTFWTRAQRLEDDRERRLLRRYLDGLHAHGVTGYGWDNLVTDYRVMLAHMVFDAVWNATSGSSAAYWQPKMRCLLEAYQDWDCARLLEG
jgi:hypothetical protein